MAEKKKLMPPLIESAATNGLIVGGLVIAFLIFINIGSIFGLLGIVCGMSGIFWLYRQQWYREREARTETHRGVSGAALASYGVAISFFAALPVALFVYVYLRFIQPDFIVNQLSEAAAVMNSTADYKAMALQLEEILEHGPIPTASEIMSTILTMMMVSGLAFGIVGAVIVKIFFRR